MVDIVHRVGIKAPIAKVYATLSTIDGLTSWWTRDTTGESKPGGTITFRFHTPAGEEIGGFDFEVIKLDSNKEVQWRCKSGPEEWIGTDVTFNLSQDGDWTIILFAHRNWRDEVESTAHCSTKWATYLLSLRDLVETGKGNPSPNDLKIGNLH